MVRALQAMASPQLSSLLFCLSLLWLPSSAWAESLTEQVEAFLQPRLLTVENTLPDTSATSIILERPDPGTYFLRYAYGLKRHANQLLATSQAIQLTEVIEAHSSAQSRWHDERNALRCKYNQVLWLYAAADEEAAAPLRTELSEWMRLRMNWTQQEHLAQYRFARAVWRVLTPDQQSKLLAGEWKGYAKMDTGHSRGDATGKLIRRALGKPDHPEVFDAMVSEWSQARAPLQEAVLQYEHQERRIVFAMDLNSEALVDQTNQAATKAYARLYLAEADAFRRIIRNAYTDPQSGCAKAAAEAWKEAPRRFEENASELIQLLTTP